MSANSPAAASKSFIAMGSNKKSDFGDPRATIEQTRALLISMGVSIRAKSKIYRTPAFPVGSGPDFANAVVEVESSHSAQALLDLCHAAEAKVGRVRKERWGPRSLDLDLLAHGDDVLPSHEVLRKWINLPPELQSQTAPTEAILPHPRLQDRAFVLVPLMDIAPDWVHPVLGKSVREMHAALPGYVLEDITPYV